MDLGARKALQRIADDVWQLEMTVQLHLSTIEAAEPGPVTKHQLARLLRDLEKQLGRLRTTIAGAWRDTESGPEDKTQVRTDLPT